MSAVGHLYILFFIGLITILPGGSSLAQTVPPPPDSEGRPQEVSEEARELITKEQFIEMLKIRAAKEKYPESKLQSVEIERQEPARVTVNILFKVGSTELAGDFSVRQMQEAGEALSSDTLAGYRFEIAGHTDDVGSDEANLSLSQKRAEAVKQFLVQYYGIAPDRLIPVGYGETCPVASNETDEGRAKNRRVVFTRIDDWDRADPHK